MNRFLREEWRDTDVPEAVYRRARDRAWERIRKGERTRSPIPILGTLAAAAIVACILLLQIPDAPPVSEKITSLPLPNDRGMDSLALMPRPKPWPVAPEAADKDQSLTDRIQLKEEVPPSRRAETAVARISTQTKQRTARQLVLHFRLPKTGTRMMWILTKEGL